MYSYDYLVAINHVMQMQPFAKAFCYVTTVSDIASTNQPSLFGGAPLGNLGLKGKSYRWSASKLFCYLMHDTIKPDSEYRFYLVWSGPLLAETIVRNIVCFKFK